MNLAQYITDSAKANSKINNVNNGFRAYLDEKIETSTERILGILSKPMTACEIRDAAGYSKGGIYKMLKNLKSRDLVYVVGDVKIGKQLHRVWGKTK